MRSFMGMGYTILMSRFFDPFILAVVILNCVFLALFDPTKPENEQKSYIYVGEIVFSIIYLLEMILKMTVLSLNSYFRDRWNWLDFVVVLEAIAGIVVQWLAGAEIANISVLRVLRPLRLANFLPVVKLLFLSFSGSIAIFGTLLMYIGFFVLAFGNFAWTYWVEELEFTCVDDMGQALDQWNVLVCDSESGRGFQCPPGFTCIKGEGNHHPIFSSVLSYNTIYYSMLQVFQAVSLEGWQPILWVTSDAIGLVPTTIFYMSCIFLGNILLVLLFPAAYSNQLQLVIENSEGTSRQEQKRKECSSNNNNRLGLKPPKGRRNHPPSFSALPAATAGGIENCNLYSTSSGGSYSLGGSSGKPCLSELELLLHNNSRYEVEELEKIHYMEAMRRGEVKEQEPEEQPIPALTPFPNSRMFNSVRKAILNELGPFNLFIYSTICLDAFVLSTWHAGQPQTMSNFLNGSYLLFTVFFVVEAVVRLFFLSPIAYFTSLLNIFDCVVTACAVAEVALGSGGGILIFRLVRLFRLPSTFRLASLGRNGTTTTATMSHKPGWQMDLPRMIKLLLRAALWVIYIYIVLVIAIYIFSVLGMQFFGNSELPQANPSTNDLSFNYSSFGKSIITVLNMLTGSYWVQTMYDTVDAVGVTSIAYYVAWLILSRWVMLAAVVSILFYQVDRDGEEHLRVMARASVRSVYALDHAFKQTCRNMLYTMWYQKYCDIQCISKEKGRVQVLQPPNHSEPPKTAFQKMMESDRALLVFEANSLPRLFMAWVVTDPPGIFSCCNSSSVIEEDLEHHRRCLMCINISLLKNSSLQRRVNALYNIFMLFVVVLSAVFIAMSAEIHTQILDPIEWDRTLRHMEIFITVVFCLDAAMKSIAHGFIFCHGAYLTFQLNRIYFFVTICYVTSLVVGNSNNNTNSTLSSLLLVFRLFRVIDFIHLAPMSTSFVKLLESVKNARRAIVISICITFWFWYMWSVVGLHIWAGSLNYCNDINLADENGVSSYHTYTNYPPRIRDKAECIAKGFEWVKPQNTFDNLGESLWSVFIVFTMDYWHPIMFDTITAATNQSLAAESNAIFWGNLATFLYFLFSILCFIILIYLFIAVIYSTFTYINNTHGGKRLLSLKQAFWAQYYNKLIYIEPHMEPERPEKGFRRAIYAMLTDSRFERTFVGFILYNLITRFFYSGTFSTYEKAPTWVHFQEIACSFVFVLEWILRVIAFGGIRAVMQTFYQFLDSIATVVMGLVFINEVFSLGWSFINAISVVRVIRLGVYVKKISELAYVISKSLPVITSLVVLFFLLTFVWAIIGMLAFQSDAFSNIFGTGKDYEMVNRYTRFDTVPLSMLTLLGIATSPGSNGWTPVMLTFTRAAPDEWSWAVGMFFISYAFLCNFLIWNLFMMVLVYSYKVYSADKAGIAMEQVIQVRDVWKAYSFKETGSYRTILGWQLPAFLQELPTPLGVGKNSCYLDAQALAKRLLVIISEEDDEWSDAKTQWPWEMRLYLCRSKYHKRSSNNSHSLDSSSSSSSFGGSGGLLLLSWQNRLLRSFCCGQGDGNGGVNILSRRPGSSFLPPGERPLEFSAILVALHKVLIFGEQGNGIDMDREVSAIRYRARVSLSVLRLGARNFIGNLKIKKRRCNGNNGGGEDDTFASLLVVSLLRRQAPHIFGWYCIKALSIEFTRWRDEIDTSGYNYPAHLEGPVLASCIRNEIKMANLQIRLYQRFLEKKGADHQSCSHRLAELKGFIKELHLLLSRVTTLHLDSVEPLWDAKSLTTTQVIEPPPLASADTDSPGSEESKRRGSSVSGMCMSGDAEWIMCCTTSGKLYVYRRHHRHHQQQLSKGGGVGSSPQVDPYILNQSLEIRSKDEMNSSSGLCVACSDNGQHVVVGCEDSMIRMFSCSIGRGKSPSSSDRNRKRQRVLFKPDIIYCGHKASVLCVRWITISAGRRFWISGGADGFVYLWRFRSKHPLQQVKVGISFIGGLSVSCLTMWSCKLSINILAACVEASRGRDISVQAPVYVLVGDSSGYLHVFPLRYDTQFLTGPWKAQLKVRAYHDGSSVTAINVAEDRVYTAGGSIGTIKIWQPIFANEMRQEVEQLVLIGQQSVHSAPVTCIGFAGGLLHTADVDMSVVTWHTSTQDKGMDISNMSDCDVKPVTYNTEPGFIAHCGEIRGMVAHKCHIATVDKYGRLVIRSPGSLDEKPLFHQVPSNETIASLLPTARKLLRDQREYLGGGGGGGATVSELVSGPNAPMLRFLRRATARRKVQAAGADTIMEPRFRKSYSKHLALERHRSFSHFGSQMEGYLRKYSNLTAACAAVCPSPFSSGLQGYERLTGKASDTSSPFWAHSFEDLEKIRDPSRFLAAIICFHFPPQTLKGAAALSDPPVLSSRSSNSWKTDSYSSYYDKEEKQQEEGYHCNITPKTGNMTLMICWGGLSAKFPYEPLQTIHELTFIATDYYRSSFGASDSQQRRVARLSRSTRSSDELSPELLVRDVLEHLGNRMLYLILGKDEEESNYNSSSFLHSGVAPNTSTVISSFHNTVDGHDSSTSTGTEEDNGDTVSTAVQDNNIMPKDDASGGGLLAQILGLVRENSTTCSEESNSESDS